MIDLIAPALDLLQIAHETQLPHEEPMEDSGGGASVIVVVAGVVVSLLAVGALVWLKKRSEADPGAE